MIDSSFWQNKSFVALDLETTGFDYSNCSIIEIGAVLFQDGKEKSDFSCLINPHKKLPTFIKQLTGISDQELKDKGIGIKEALIKLKEFIQDYPLICHNSSFDIGFIQYNLTTYQLSPLTNQNYDTLELSKIYLPFLDNHKLATVAKGLDISAGKYHRALNDAHIAGLIFHKLIDFVIENIPLELNNSIYQIAETSDKLDYTADLTKSITEHQQKFTLLNDGAVNHHKLYRSLLAAKLGFTKSHNLIRSELWNAKNEEQGELADVDINTEDSAKKSTDLIIDESFKEGGFFSKSFPQYEHRAGQIEMAYGVESAFQNGEILLAEAGTGIGKSLAYLIPALHFAYLENKKVYVSTNTKNLQEQLFYKDLPMIRNSTPIPFQGVILKGRDNYLCLKKWKELVTGFRNLLSPYEIANLVYLPVWQAYTRTGDVSENTSFFRESEDESRKTYSSIWKRLSSERFFCSGKRCSNFSSCYYMMIRQKADSSSLVIINHSLMLTDLSNDKFGDDQENYLIVDEAHNLPEMAASYLGISLSFSDFGNLFNQLVNINKRRGLQTGILPTLKANITQSLVPAEKRNVLHSDIDLLTDVIEDSKQEVSEVFREIGDRVTAQGSYGKLRIKELETTLENDLNLLIKSSTELEKRLVSLVKFVSHIPKNQLPSYEDNVERIEGALEKTKLLVEALKIVKAPDWSNYVLWFSSYSSSDSNIANGVINYAPLDVSEILLDILYNKVKALVFTSATLSLRNNFKFFSLRMGLDLLADKSIKEMIIPSPFDYNKQAKVVIAGYLPQPSDRFFAPQCFDLLKESLSVSKGGSLILFTSYKDLFNVYDNISEELYQKDILLLAQGKGYSRTATINEFKENGRAVLLGTSSFWEGVDIPGASLSLLIIYKLPFQVPSEPIVEAYHEKLKRENRDPFYYATLPNAMLRLRQGLGRLIRSRNDKGVILITDSRVITKRYGSYFYDVIPTKFHNAETPIEIRDIIGNWFDREIQE